MYFHGVVWCTLSIVTLLFPLRSSAEDPSRAVRLSSTTLPNLIRVHPRVYSGGLPESDDAFRELQALGIKTIVSVDAAKPDVDRARHFDLHYVHLPHGYNGIPAQRAWELAKGLRELPGPIYVHCHHGKHRSPAAAAVACITAGWIPREQGLSILKLAGTNPDYRGLYQSVADAIAVSEKQLAELDVVFTASVAPAPIAEAMLQMEHHFDALQKESESNPTENASPPQSVEDALLLRESYTELLRSELIHGKSAAFRDMLRDGETACQQLEMAVKESTLNPTRQETRDACRQAFERVSHNCHACHRQFRDIPLQESAQIGSRADSRQ